MQHLTESAISRIMEQYIFFHKQTKCEDTITPVPFRRNVNRKTSGGITFFRKKSSEKDHSI